MARMFLCVVSLVIVVCMAQNELSGHYFTYFNEISQCFGGFSTGYTHDPSWPFHQELDRVFPLRILGNIQL
jgi:hypothetical protein